MSTYYDKKKLIEDNSDLYISDYDKNLDYSYLSDIINQKRAYQSAQSVGDEQGMKNANDRANSVRMHAGSYIGGDDGSGYTKVKLPYESGKPTYQDNKYSKEADRIYKLISSYNDFDYDVYSDPLYKTYKDIYLSLGDDAYERTLGENAMRTGGIASTSAISAATQAKNKYNTMLANIVPELYDKAYAKHRDGIKDLYNLMDLANDFDKTEYDRYRDSVDDFNDDREYFYEKDKNANDSLYQKYKDETNLAYDISRDYVDDTSANDKLNFEKEKFEKELELDSKEADDITRNKKLSVAVNLAKALYGKVPVSKSVITSIMNMLE